MLPSAYCLRGEGSTRFGYFESSDLDASVSSANNAKRGVFPEPTSGSPSRIGARLPGSGPRCTFADRAFNGLSEYATATSEKEIWHRSSDRCETKKLVRHNPRSRLFIQHDCRTPKKLDQHTLKMLVFTNR